MMKSSAENFAVGDLVRVEYIPNDLDDTAGIGTPEVFEQALGKTFRVEGFNAVGHLELVVVENHPSAATYESDTIWIEPQFVSLVARLA
jgi:hypothetical protein